MKKILLLIVLLTLTGCSNTNEDTCKEGYESRNGVCYQIEPIKCDEGQIEKDGTCIEESISCKDNETLVAGSCIVQDEVIDNCHPFEEEKNGVCDSLIRFQKTYNVIDQSELFTIESQTIDLYESEIDTGTPYVKVDDYLSMLGSSIKQLTISKEDTLTLSLIRVFDVDLEPYVFTLEMDPVENTLDFSDFSIVYYLNNYDFENEYEPSYEVVGTTYDYENTEVLIDLDDYHFNIAYQDGEFYLPFFIMDMFFSGENLNSVVAKDNVYIYDGIYQEESYDEILFDTSNNIETTVRNTYHYLALHFDYFYGLKDFEEIAGFYPLLDEHEIAQSTSLKQLNERIHSFFISLDDLHSSMVYFGMDEDKLDIDDVFYRTNYREFFYAYNNQQCFDREEDTALVIHDFFYVLEINGFTLDTKDEIKELVKDIGDKPILVDLTCNTGGVVTGALDVLSFLTSDPVQVNYEFPMNGAKLVEVISPDSALKIDNQIVVVTSKVTYSAGNLLTSIIKDNEIAPIYGRTTAGGAAIVRQGVLPTGGVFTFSGDIVFNNDQGEIIEDGIASDFEPLGIYDMEDIHHMMVSDLLFYVPFDITDYSINTKLGFDVQSDFSSEGFEFEKYTFVVYDITTDEKVLSMDYHNESFIAETNISVQGEFAYIELYVSYIYQGLPYQILLHYSFPDDHPSSVHPNITPITIGEMFSGKLNHSSDGDILLVEITEAGYYEIEINEIPQFGEIIFDENFEKIYRDGIEGYYLEVGTYYINIRSSFPDYTGIIYYIE